MPTTCSALQARYFMGQFGQKGPLPLFLEHELVQIVRQAGPEAHIESLGVRDWNYVGAGYLVEQDYRVTTPEGTYDVLIPVFGGAGSSPGRQWHVVFTDQLTVRQRNSTPWATPRAPA